MKYTDLNPVFYGAEIAIKGGHVMTADIERRAMVAYFRTDGGWTVRDAEPEVLEHAGKRYVVVRNADKVDNVLAVYRVRNDGMLKRLKRWPVELNNR
jgi:hypothetical protein